MSLLLTLLRQVLEYYGVPPDLMSLVWERKNYGSTRSFVRRLGKYLSLTPCLRPHFQLVRSVNSLEFEEQSIVNSLTQSLADVLWMPDDDREPHTKFRSDEWRETATLSMLPVSSSSSQKATSVNVDTFRKISTLENELALLRRQIATLVAVQKAGNDPSCSDTVNSSNRPSSGFLQAKTSTPAPVSPYNKVMPPPPPVLQSDFDSCNSAIELIKQRRAASRTRNIAEDGGRQDVKAIPSMMDVLKDINKVKLRTVERSPGGTPLPKSKKKMQSQWDPAAIIAEALKEKFASQSNNDDSFDKGNRSYGVSPFSSPDTPGVGCRILKPSMKQTLPKTEELIFASSTKTVIHL